MNPEAQRIALAESQGWERFDSVAQLRYGYAKDYCDPAILPDYLTDLNAIHAAAKAECEKRGWSYIVRYAHGRYSAMFDADSGPYSAVNPDQCAALCEAILRALNLWTE